MGFRNKLKLLRPEVPHRIDLDTTEMSPGSRRRGDRPGCKIPSSE